MYNLVVEAGQGNIKHNKVRIRPAWRLRSITLGIDKLSNTIKI